MVNEMKLRNIVVFLQAELKSRMPLQYYLKGDVDSVSF